jgi:acetyltransferase-like isoleucine patch superfamily enzyme
VGAGARIGSGTKLLYGSQLFNNCRIGRNCIVGGDVSERVVLEDNVTFMGSIAHSHRNPTADWDTTDEPSPVFKRGCVVGVEALIIGGITIGEGAYIGAREVVRTDVPPQTVVYKGKWRPMAEWRGFLRSRLSGAVRDETPKS